jgi:ANTAR domain/GAF domain
MIGHQGATPTDVGTEHPVRRMLVESARALQTGDSRGVARWCVEGCTSWLDVAAAGLVEVTQADGADGWEVTASHEQVHELIERDLHLVAGPCRESIETGAPVIVADLADLRGGWPDFAARARAQGFVWAHARPLHLHEAVIGALLLLGTSSDIPAEEDLELGHALAQLAAATGFQRLLLARRDIEVEQLHTALDSRVVIEQAKGIIAARYHINLEEAFVRLRRHARNRRANIHVVAADVVHDRHVPGLT